MLHLMNRQPPPQIFIYTALPCEAKPLVEHFALKKDTSIGPFAVYFNQTLCLTVTGIGKNAMSAGAAYSQALFGFSDYSVLINIGIAGHKTHDLGSLFLIDKITDFDTGKSYYPPLVFTPTCPTTGIQTASKPQLAYDQSCLCDMEASAFYETAMRFSSAELIQCLKIVSDNKLAPAENIQPKQVTQFIATHVASIETLLGTLSQLSKLVAEPKPRQYEQLIKRYRFTISEQGQLKSLLSRWEVLTGQQSLELDEAQLHKGKDVLAWLDRQINGVEFWV